MAEKDLSLKENQKQGIIIKGIGGFYYVESAQVLYECKARGVFRKNGITPMCGDRVVISVNEEERAENTIDEVLPRKNFLLRPPVANIDRLIIVVAGAEPRPNTLLIDRLTAMNGTVLVIHMGTVGIKSAIFNILMKFREAIRKVLLHDYFVFEYFKTRKSGSIRNVAALKLVQCTLSCRMLSSSELLTYLRRLD